MRWTLKMHRPNLLLVPEKHLKAKSLDEEEKGAKIWNPALYRFFINVLSMFILHMIIIRFLTLNPFCLLICLWNWTVWIVCENYFSVGDRKEDLGWEKKIRLNEYFSWWWEKWICEFFVVARNDLRFVTFVASFPRVCTALNDKANLFLNILNK